MILLFYVRGSRMAAPNWWLRLHAKLNHHPRFTTHVARQVFFKILLRPRPLQILQKTFYASTRAPLRTSLFHLVFLSKNPVVPSSKQKTLVARDFYYRR